jgi:hypothetical protein
MAGHKRKGSDGERDAVGDGQVQRACSSGVGGRARGRAGSACQVKELDFVGTWTPDDRTPEWPGRLPMRTTRRETARATARPSSGYGLVGCHVTGRHYRFTVTYGSSYRSVDTGTISPNRL